MNQIFTELKMYVVYDAAVRLRLVICGLRHIYFIQNRLERRGEGKERRGQSPF
jgi:hypothetical protein